MSGVATAIAGAAVVGAYASNKAADKAADSAQYSSDQSIAYMQQSEEKARKDIEELFPKAANARNERYQQGMDFYTSTVPESMDAVSQGNYNAQQTLSAAMPQIQNAILGGNIDYSFAQPKQQSVDINSLLAGMPTIYNASAQQATTQPAQQSSSNSGYVTNPTGTKAAGQIGGNNWASTKYGLGRPNMNRY